MSNNRLSRPSGALAADLIRNRWKYLLVLPVILYFILFAYKPMYGVIIAFKDFRPSLGIWDSPWAGFKHFENFFQDVYFRRIITNTFAISLLSILWGFPAPIILALLLNELKCLPFKRTVQTISYMPHFISLVVLCGIIRSFTLTDGAANDVIVFLGGQRSSLLSNPALFRTIYVATDIWQQIGWGSIIYLAALSGIDQEQYEAARIDGAGRFRQMTSITLPGLLPTISVLFILRMGGVLNVGFEKILLLYQPTTYEVADVISTYVYRKGIMEGGWSYSTAIGLFNSLVNVVFLLVTNALSKKYNEVSLF